MGWRSTGAAFRAGNYSGPLTSDQGGFASGFAATFNAGISKAADIIVQDMAADKEQEREMELIRLRETLAAQRAAATRSADRDKDDNEAMTIAREIAASYGINDPEIITYFSSVVVANDGDGSQARNAIQEMVDNGSFILPTGPQTAAPATPTEPATTDPAQPPEAVAPTADSPTSELPSVFNQPEASPASMDDLEATEEPLVPEPAVFRPDEDTAEVVEAQATEEPAQTTEAAPIGVPETPAPSGPRFDFEAPMRTEIAGMDLPTLLAELELARSVSNPNTRRIQLIETALRAKQENEIMGLSDDELQSRAAGTGPMAEMAQQALTARQEARDRAGEDPEVILEGLETVAQTASRRLSVANDPELPEGSKQALLAILDGHIQTLLDLERQQAENRSIAEQEFMLYAPQDRNGLISGAGFTMLRPNAEGQLVDQSGRVVEGSWTPLNEDNLEATVSFNNTRINEIIEPMINTANVVRDLVDLRDIISNNPAVTNRFAVGAEGLRSLVNDGMSLITSVMEDGRNYTYAEVEQIIQSDTSLSQAAREVELLKLRVAYGLAGLDGSRGQALSDRELAANMDAVFSMGNPENAIALINRNISRAIQVGETRRSASVDSMPIFGRSGEAMFQDAVWRTPMSDFVVNQVGEERQASLQAALANEIPELAGSTTLLPNAGGDDELGSLSNPIILPEGVTPATVGQYVGPGQYYLTPGGQKRRMPME